MPRIVIDTNILFSAIYSRTGNEARLFEMADEGRCTIHLLDHVLLEIDRVFDERSIPKDQIHDLLDTYDNIFIHEMNEIGEDEIALAKRIINDPGDRPIFLFAKRMIDHHDDTYLITGDRVFHSEDVKKYLDHRVKKTKEILDIID